MKKEELLLQKEAGQFDEKEFLEIFRESSEENAPAWYPELGRDAALQKYEDGFLQYMREAFFQKEGGILAVLRDEAHYRSSLRLYPYGAESRFFVEAFETRPDSRKLGFGKRLYKAVIAQLEKEYGEIELLANVYKTNAASIAAHLSAGFVQEKEYWEEEDGTRNDKQVTMVYRTKREI